MKIAILLLILILTSCNSNSQNTDIILTGKIGGFDAEISLKKEGDFFKGVFRYVTINKKQINLQGQIESNELRLSEFNDKNEITGFFNGNYKNDEYHGKWSGVNGEKQIPFHFSKNKELGVFELKSKELLRTYFEAKEYKTDSIATYITKDDAYEIEFHKFENYTLEGKQYSLAIFGNYPLYNYFGEGDFDRGMTTATIGDSAFSIIKFVKEGNNWVFVNIFKKFEGGVTLLDHLPKIKQIGNFTFLELNSTHEAAGFQQKSTRLLNIINFQESLGIYSDANQAIDGTDVDKFIKERNNEADYEFSKSWWASNVMIKFTTQNEKLLCIADYIYGKFDEKKNKFVKEETTIIYTYNEDTMEFVELK
ncbi:hypothetical protein [Lacinutrix himadriensis]|uniref:hypothetical protein n=1 Tax=Lacinutrix himadriensis TaxID=641549 RepID=UPI0006E3D70B|nr:hypothetical protein [Lacinutrix himadriensis]